MKPRQVGITVDCDDAARLAKFWEQVLGYERRPSAPGSPYVTIELLNRQRWRTNLELAIAIADYIDHFYNAARRHSALAYHTPNEFEAIHSAKTPATTS